MEAPKKIYLCPSDSVTTDYEEEWLEYPWGEDNVEYIRTDIFIENVREFIKKHFYSEDSWHVESETPILDKIIEDFKKYIH